MKVGGCTVVVPHSSIALHYPVNSTKALPFLDHVQLIALGMQYSHAAKRQSS